MKIKTSELAGPALDWAVAKCFPADEFLFDPAPYLPDENGEPKYFYPSTHWQDGGPIIEQEGLSVQPAPDPHHWLAASSVTSAVGPHPLVAAMRCYVAAKLGNEVAVPQELA